MDVIQLCQWGYSFNSSNLLNNWCGNAEPPPSPCTRPGKELSREGRLTKWRRLHFPRAGVQVTDRGKWGQEPPVFQLSSAQNLSPQLGPLTVGSPRSVSFSYMRPHLPKQSNQFSQGWKGRKQINCYCHLQVLSDWSWTRVGVLLKDKEHTSPQMWVSVTFITPI